MPSKRPMHSGLARYLHLFSLSSSSSSSSSSSFPVFFSSFLFFFISFSFSFARSFNEERRNVDWFENRLFRLFLASPAARQAPLHNHHSNKGVTRATSAQSKIFGANDSFHRDGGGGGGGGGEKQEETNQGKRKRIHRRFRETTPDTRLTPVIFRRDAHRPPRLILAETRRATGCGQISSDLETGFGNFQKHAHRS